MCAKGRGQENTEPRLEFTAARAETEGTREPQDDGASYRLGAASQDLGPSTSHLLAHHHNLGFHKKASSILLEDWMFSALSAPAHALGL